MLGLVHVVGRPAFEGALVAVGAALFVSLSLIAEAPCTAIDADLSYRIRTAAASALATDVLADPGTSTVTGGGSGAGLSSPRPPQAASSATVQSARIKDLLLFMLCSWCAAYCAPGSGVPRYGKAASSGPAALTLAPA